MKVVWLATAYFLSGKLGLLLAVPPGYATAVFPASGIALAGMLVFGYRVWPGILVGSFFLNVTVSFDGSMAATIGTSLLLALGIAGGAVLQSVVSAFLVRRFVTFPIAFNKGRQVLLLLFWGGPIGCLINAIVATAVLVTAGRIPLDNFLFNSATWWIGDSFGVLVFTPLLLVWAQNPGKSRFEGNMMVTIPAIATFMVAVLVVWYASSWEKMRLKQNFENQANFLSSALEKNLSEYLGVLNSLNSFLVASDKIDRDKFRTFTGGLLSSQIRIQALSWNPRIRRGDRNMFEAEARRSGLPEFRISERNDEGQLVAAGDRDEFVAVYFIEPYTSNMKAVGFDVASNTTRRAALNQARDTGQPTSTGRIKLVQETEQQYGTLTFVPVYDKDIRDSSLETRRAALKGFVVGVLRMGDLVKETFAPLETMNLVFQLRDLSAKPEKQLLFASPSQEGAVPKLEERGVFGGSNVLLHSRSYDFGGRIWSLQTAPTQQYIADHRPENSWLLLVAGMLISSLVVVFSVVFMGRDKELTDTHNKLKLILSSAAEGIYGIDTHGHCTFCNPAGLKMLGYESEKELIGQNMREVFHQSDSNGEKHPTKSSWAIKAVLQDKGIHVDDEIIWRRDGSTFPAEYWSYPIRTEAGTVGAVVTFLDITNRKQTQAQLLQSQKMEVVGHLAGGVAHDFNNVLNIMMGKAELLELKTEGNKKTKPDIKAILMAVKRGASLTERLLAFSRQQSLSPKPTKINRLIQGLEDMLQSALGETVEISTHLGEETFKALIDPHQFENALLNLAVNARDAMPHGGQLTIRTGNVTLDDNYARQHEEIKPGDYVEVTVSDTGTGMADEVLENVYEPFFTTKEVGKGSGLGLSMVYGFVKQSNGHVSIDSELGQGTTVKLYLPSTQEAEVEEKIKGETRKFALGSERVLVVEDDDEVREIPISFLRKQGYEVIEAKNGPEAIRHLQEDKPIDLLFTDVVLPGGMNGAEIAEEAKRIQPEIKIIFTSGYSENAIVRDNRVAPGVILVNKPYRRAKLLEKVRSVLDGVAE